MTRVNFLLELTEVRNRWKKELRMCICEIFKPEIFSLDLHLKLYWLLRFGSRSKTPQQNFTTVPTWDLNKGFPREAFVKVPAPDSSKLSPKLGVSNISSSGLKLRLPKWDFDESFSSKLNQTLPNLRFSNSPNSGLKQGLPK